MTVPLISVITPVFNGRDYIEQCIENVAGQGCPQAEHIVVDGGSDDGTVEIIERLASRYSALRWLSEPDRGQSDAMNKGVDLARGSVLGFLNADDYYEPGVLPRIIQLFRDLPEPSLAVGNCSVWREDGSLWFVSTPSRISLEALLEERYLEAFPMNSSGYFYHKSLHRLIGPYPVEEHYSMDLDFIIRAVAQAKVYYHDEHWGNYRYLPGTKTFQDDQSGMNAVRIAALIASYRKHLPPSTRARMVAGIRVRRALQRIKGIWNGLTER
jgi:glycosyltransferase involved in cell wall biosynthesis